MFLNCLIFELRSLIISDGKATKILANSESYKNSLFMRQRTPDMHAIHSLASKIP